MPNRALVLALVLAACGGELDSGDASTCSPGDVKTGCACDDAGVIENACACAALVGCDGGPRWACYPLAASCPQAEPVASSPCATTSLTCDYVRASGTADERTCDGTKWNAGTVTTFCQ